MNKLNSPNQLAILSAAALSGTVWLLSIVLGLLLGFSGKQWLFMLLPILIFGMTYWLIRGVLDRYIKARVDVLYRTVDGLKKPKAKDFDLKNDVLAKVTDDVNGWTAEHADEIVQLRKMEAYRSEFIGNISHELKTPIFNIQGYLDTLLEGAIADPNVNERYLQRAADNAERLNLIVSDLNTIAQLESDSLQLAMGRFDLRLLLQEVLEDMQVLAAPLNIKIKCDRPKFMALWVTADRDKIHAVLTNLLTNALKYGVKEGTVKINFFEIDAAHVLVEISDNGMGIEQKHLPRLFERFYRTDAARSRTAGGTGLGLAIVKHIVEAHQQTIHVRSEINKGTTFGFTLSLV
jgi:two-component system, OmpR family, phosphate regulon sensor histidine kinase PhoR